MWRHRVPRKTNFCGTIPLLLASAAQTEYTLNGRISSQGAVFPCLVSIYRSGPSLYSSFIQEHLPFLFLPFTLSPSFIANGHWRAASSEGSKARNLSAFPPLLATRHLHLVSFLNAPNLSLVSKDLAREKCLSCFKNPSLALFETRIQPASYTISQSFTKTHTHTHAHTRRAHLFSSLSHRNNHTHREEFSQTRATMDVILSLADTYALDTLWGRILTPASPSSPLLRNSPKLLKSFLQDPATVEVLAGAAAAKQASGGVGSGIGGSLLANLTSTLVRAASSSSAAFSSRRIGSAADIASSLSSSSQPLSALANSASNLNSLEEIDWDAISNAGLSALTRDNWIR